MDFDTLWQAALRGSVTGLGSGLLALGLVVTFRSTGVLNLSLGGIASVSAYVLWALWGRGSAPLALALPVALAAGAGLGAAGERVLRPVRGSSIVVKAVASLGLLLVLQGMITLFWGSSERFLPLLVDGSIARDQLVFRNQELLASGLALAAAGAIAWWTRSFPSGTATLAVAEDPDAARLLGIRPTRVAATVWAISGLLAALAGILLSGLTLLNTVEMTLALVTALAAALLAGFTSVGLAVAGAALVGGATSVAASVPELARVGGLIESLGFLAVIAVMVFVRPRRAATRLERA